MFEALAFPFFQRALLAGVLAAVACGVIGTWVVARRMASISGGLAHAAFGGYVAQERIPREIRLPGGKVSCVSCHQGYSASHGALVSLGNGSPLCGSCHDL